MLLLIGFALYIHSSQCAERICQRKYLLKQLVLISYAIFVAYIKMRGCIRANKRKHATTIAQHRREINLSASYLLSNIEIFETILIFIRNDLALLTISLNFVVPKSSDIEHSRAGESSFIQQQDVFLESKASSFLCFE